MPDSLDLVQLRSFVAIADCGGFGRAAAALHLSQPTVSQHVRLLEKRLDAELVRRDGRRTRFTDAGERLLVEARRILSVHDQALERLDAASRSRIVIGSAETAADQVLPGVLARLRAAFPHHGVQFHIDRSTQMTEAVARGTIDLAVILSTTPDTPGRRVGSLPLAWYAAPGWQPPAGGERWPLVAYVEPCGMRQRALHELAEAGLTVDVVAESTSLEGVMGAARAGLGVAVLPSAGRLLPGLVERNDLPDLGLAGVHLTARRGLDIDVEAAALAAMEGFFAELRGTASADLDEVAEVADEVAPRLEHDGR
ncbi:LysR family transcriptional regulator [Streptomyces radicis]|uniref:LysR family transcriptional regulator n=1 Tax=Streptomyces radicis TaxID=1750517 RepID=A0A3A9VV15_9ACTN|nr:LysR family transcriptional regulator [Streptomyces radicis]RKN04590.1 LysR family transcriptional regulator [Streptomyces radicis]RKN15546.1 LysR family transcriptional regulator [Streptomyces radicis]